MHLQRTTKSARNAEDKAAWTAGELSGARSAAAVTNYCGPFRGGDENGGGFFGRRDNLRLSSDIWCGNGQMFVVFTRQHFRRRRVFRPLTPFRRRHVK